MSSSLPGGAPIIAIVGRPNVGKSCLFNRLIQKRRSIVADTAGVTRDRIYQNTTLTSGPVERDAVLVDTGGFDPQNQDPIMRRVLEQTEFAIDEADVVVFMVDARAGVMPEDHDIARLLRKAEKPVILAANKVDGPKQAALVHEFHGLGMGEPLGVSAAHGAQVGELEDRVVARLPPFQSAPSGVGIAEVHDDQREGAEDALLSLPEVEPLSPDEPQAWAEGRESVATRLAVIGRPNAGKSSLVNRLLGEDRHLVSEIPGTTVDSVDSLVSYRDEAYLFIDTAGLRRKRSIAMRVEKFSVVAALKALERSDVALLLLDASRPIAAQDAKVSAFAFERGKAVILVASKWDLVAGKMTQKEWIEAVRLELPHLNYAPVVFTSAHSGYGVERLMPTIKRVHREYGRRVGTAALNRFVASLTGRHAPPSRKGKPGRIYYISQIDVRPPRFLVSVNDPGRFHFSYRRFLINELRKNYGFRGVPLLVGYRSHQDREEGEKRRRFEKGKKQAEKDPRKQASKVRRARKLSKRVKRRRRPSSPS